MLHFLFSSARNVAIITYQLIAAAGLNSFHSNVFWLQDRWEKVLQTSYGTGITFWKVVSVGVTFVLILSALFVFVNARRRTSKIKLWWLYLPKLWPQASKMSGKYRKNQLLYLVSSSASVLFVTSIFDIWVLPKSISLGETWNCLPIFDAEPHKSKNVWKKTH